MNTRILNLTDDHRRLHLQHSEDEPTFLYVLLFVEDRVLVCARVDLKRCRFSMSSDGPLFWVGKGTNFLITEQERREIERFLWVLTRAPLPIHRDVPESALSSED